MPPTIWKKALKETARVTKPEGTVVVVDYALPKNKIGKFLIYHVTKLWEKYYPQFIKCDLQALLRRSEVEVKETLAVLSGTARILKGIRVGYHLGHASAGTNSPLIPEFGPTQEPT